MDLKLGQVVGLTRKSTDTRLRKSFADQEEAILAICAKYELPIDSNQIWREMNGLSSHLSMVYANLSPIDGNDGTNKVRPILIKLVDGIRAGRIRCVAVWSLGDLKNCVDIMDALVTTAVKYNCAIYDRHGPVDIFTPAGREIIHANMIAAKTIREIYSHQMKREPDFRPFTGSNSE